MDVLFLQETHSDSLNSTDWSREWEGKVLLSHGSAASAGVGILFARSFSPITVEVEQVVEGRLMVVLCVLNKRMQGPDHGSKFTEF